MAYFDTRHNKRTTIPTRRFWLIVKLVRLLLKLSGDGKHEETWEKQSIMADGTQKYSFYIQLYLPKQN